MALVLNDLKSLLETETSRLYTDGANSLLYPFVHDGQMFHAMASIMEDGGYVQLSIPYLMNLRDVDDRESVLVTLLDLNRRIKALKFCYDPSDGEVSASIEIPLEDGTLTERQAHRCMYVLVNIAIRERDNLLTLIKTGVYPGSSDPGFTETIGRLLGSEDSAGPDPEDESEEAMTEFYGSTSSVALDSPENAEN